LSKKCASVGALPVPRYAENGSDGGLPPGVIRTVYTVDTVDTVDSVHYFE